MFKVKDMKGIIEVPKVSKVHKNRYEKMPLKGKGSEEPSTAKGGKTPDNT